MRDHFVQSMQKVIDNKQAEVAPLLQLNEECWYLPMFGVYHPQKPKQISVVFDSSVKHEGVALNNVEQMFYCFTVRDDHCNFLRFLWFKDNDVTKVIIEYRMKVHVFGNRPSPSVAIYGLRKTAEASVKEYGKDKEHFVTRNLYVNNGLISLQTEFEAIALLQKTQNMLAESNLFLHKIASNSSKVMEALPANDLAKDIKNLDLDTDPLPVQEV